MTDREKRRESMQIRELEQRQELEQEKKKEKLKERAKLKKEEEEEVQNRWRRRQMQQTSLDRFVVSAFGNLNDEQQEALAVLGWKRDEYNASQLVSIGAGDTWSAEAKQLWRECVPDSYHLRYDELHWDQVKALTVLGVRGVSAWNKFRKAHVTGIEIDTSSSDSDGDSSTDDDSDSGGGARRGQGR